ncbi:MAG: hypothetical protein FWH43_01580 [Endomicrobia bacterium]|nr:hypothetical protein [Endomicrobiia bacterium]
MKKIILSLLVLCLAIFFNGCGNNDKVKKNNSKSLTIGMSISGPNTWDTPATVFIYPVVRDSNLQTIDGYDTSDAIWSIDPEGAAEFMGDYGNGKRQLIWDGSTEKATITVDVKGMTCSIEYSLKENIFRPIPYPGIGNYLYMYVMYNNSDDPREGAFIWTNQAYEEMEGVVKCTRNERINLRVIMIDKNYMNSINRVATWTSLDETKAYFSNANGNTSTLICHGSGTAEIVVSCEGFTAKRKIEINP